ncbi:hypothetical protein AAC387_Pa08g1023 [Persea americana]
MRLRGTERGGVLTDDDDNEDRVPGMTTMKGSPLSPVMGYYWDIDELKRVTATTSFERYHSALELWSFVAGTLSSFLGA